MSSRIIVKAAVRRAGGVQAVMALTGASRRSVFRWIASGRVTNARWCAQLANAANMNALALAGIAEPTVALEVLHV